MQVIRVQVWYDYYLHFLNQKKYFDGGKDGTRFFADSGSYS